MAESTDTLSRWVPTLAAAVGMSLSVPVYQSYFFGLFVKPLHAEFGWGRGELSIAIMLCNYTIMLTAPLFGRLVDRWGVRPVVLPSVAATALAVGLGALNPGSLAGFHLGHILLAVAGLGTLPLAYTRVIVGWFDRDRGFALGLGLAGIGLGGAGFPHLVQHVIGQYGWRWGYVAISALMLFVALPCVAGFLRERRGRGLVVPRRADGEAVGLTLRQAMRTRQFWLLFSALLLLGAVTTGVSVHLIALLGDHGFDSRHAVAGASALGLSLVGGRLVAGFLLDRFPPRLIAALIIAGCAAGLLLLAAASNPAVLLAGVVLVGIGIGAEFDFLSYFVAASLGLKHYGAIYGVIYAGFMFGCGMGPGLMGFVFDRNGSYETALMMLACSAALAAAAFVCLGRGAGRGRAQYGGRLIS